MQINEEVYIFRSMDKELLIWKNETHRKPLLIRGARQVGKSTAIRHFSRHFKYYVEVNFEQKKEIGELFNTSLDPKQICSKLSVIYGIPIIPGQTLVFFDEIQSCIPAISSLRYFYEDYSDLHIVATGSLLEFALQELPSFGVGRIRTMFMYPFSFDEFLNAQGESLLIEEKKHATTKPPFPEVFHNKLNDYLKIFMITGGMPEVVKTYTSTKDLNKCQAILQDLTLTLTDDFAKYKKRFSPVILSKVFQIVAKSTGAKFIYASISENIKIHQVKEALELLTNAGIIIPVTHTSANGIPLGAETNEKLRKFILFDNGIQQSLLGLSMGDIFLSSDFTGVNKGCIAETFAGIELVKYNSCYQRTPLYYWQREERTGNAEVDYVIQRKNTILPIEIKAGTKGSMQSIQYFMSKKEISKGVRCSLENFGQISNIEIIPLYALSNLYI